MHHGKDWNEAAVLSWARSGRHSVDLGSGWARSGVIWAVLGSLFERLCGSGLHLESARPSWSRPRVSVGHLTGRCREDLGSIWARSQLLLRSISARSRLDLGGRLGVDFRKYVAVVFSLSSIYTLLHLACAAKYTHSHSAAVSMGSTSHC